MLGVRLIDANALKKKYCDCCVAGTDCMGSGCKIYNARCLIRDLPTIEPEVRHGRWKFGGFCSECGIDNEERKTDFCPNCGARMDADNEK